MPLTVAEIENATNAGIAYHFQRGNVKSSFLENKPLLKALKAKQKTFPGGVSVITRRVKFAYTTTIMGFEGDDIVSYANPTNIRTCNYPWKMIHAGISFTKDELLKNGITISDSLDGTGDRSTARAELIRLANVLEDKLDDLDEGWNRGFQNMYWQDGTQDSKVVPGVTSFVLDNPTSAVVVGGIDQNANPLWQNRAALGITSYGGGTPANQIVVQKLQKEFRQLKRYGGMPNLILAGSDFMDWFEQELRAKGNFTLEGWASRGRMDASVADLEFKGVDIEYDPFLDELNRQKYCYVLDTKTIYPMVIDGEDMQKHAPARPENRYVFYRAITWAGGLVCDQRNANGVYSISA
jgi:hypothetical protein